MQAKVVGGSGTFSLNTVGDIIYWYEFAPNSDNSDNDAKLLLLPSSMTASSDGDVPLDVDCDLSHSEAANQGYINNQDEWQNVEMTSHFFIKTVDSQSGYLFLETRNGYDGNKGGCCQGTAYGVRLYWSTTPADKGKFAFYKKEYTGSVDELAKQAQTRIPTFYQQWFGLKFCVYNISSERVKLELWLTPVIYATPSNANSNLWTKVGEVEDYAGKGWSKGGNECDAPSKDSPITWATPFSAFGWQDGKVIQFSYTSVREIDIHGTFGEDPIPPPDPTPDPTLPNPDPDPPTTPDPQPPDAEPPLTPTTLTKRLTLRREVVNNRLCSCDGIQPDIGGGGGEGEYTEVYNVTSDGYSNLGLTNQRVGERFLSGSIMIGIIPKKIIMRLSNPSSLVGTAYLRIRNTSDTIVSEFGSIDVSTIGATEASYTITNDNQAHAIAAGDRILLEYTHGSSNFRINFHTADAYSDGNRTQYTGTYSDEVGDIAWVIYSAGGGGGGGGTVPPGGGDGGGGGGTNTLLTLYNVAVNTSGFGRLATVSGNSSYYLRFGQAVTQTSSAWINKSINRVEITIAKQGTPTGGTGGGIHCRIRKGTDDSIAATLAPVVSPADVTTAGTVFTFENLTNTYRMAFNDKLLFEFDGGDLNNHIKIFRMTQPVTSGTKIMYQTNTQDAGEYSDAPDLDLCARVYTLTP